MKTNKTNGRPEFTREIRGFTFGTPVKNLFLLPALMAVLNLILAGRVTAQTFTTLHSFTAAFGYDYTNSDGAYPRAGLILTNNILYGTASGGGAGGAGTVFAVNTDGAGFTNLHSFSEAGLVAYVYTNGDGAYPYAGLILSGNTLYGTTSMGTPTGKGTGFTVNTDGMRFTNVYRFGAPVRGIFPHAGLLLSGNTLYGTTEQGGSSFSAGAVFAVNSDGTGFMDLHSFTATSAGTNMDGASPEAGLILSGNSLYGTASAGGSSGNGAVFAVNTGGMGFTNLHSFTGATDGANPRAGLILSSNTLYGTALAGGSWGHGTVFAVNTDGTGFTNLYSFTGATDGANPSAGLILSGSTLCGTASSGGTSGYGTVFAVNTDGTGFAILHSFAGSDGANPSAGLILSSNTLYGTTTSGGSSGNGTVFSLSFRPQLTITPSGTNVTLSWPISFAGFSYAEYILEVTANLGSPDAWVPSDFFPPVVVNGQVRLTGPIRGPQRFYRLKKQ